MLRSGTAQRVDYEEASGALAETVRSFGYRAAVAAPVTVGGRLWGVLAGAATSDEVCFIRSRAALYDFAELVAQALANTDAYEKLAARGRSSCRSAMRNACGSSATCTTALSSGSSRSP